MSSLIQWQNAPGAGDLVQDTNGRVVEGENVINEIFASLYINAPADPGDPVPPGVEAFRHWAIAFDDSTIRGSKLWMLPYVKPASRALEVARVWTNEALAWMVPSRLLAFDVETAIGGPIQSQAIGIGIAIVLLDETRRTFSLDIPYAV